MAEVHHFEYGYAVPALASGLSVVGCLLGLLLETKARGRRGRHRVRLLIYAALAIGGAGGWLPHFIVMLGFRVADSQLRFDPVRTAASLGVAVGIVGAGLFLGGYARPTWWRITGAGLLVGAGLAAMHYAAAAGVRITGEISYEPRRQAASVLVAAAASIAAIWCAVVLRGLRSAVMAAVGLGAAIWGVHYTAMSAMRVHVTPGVRDIAGLNPNFLLAPVLLLGVTSIVMVAFFTFGNSTLDEMRAIYQPGAEEESSVIASRIIAEVTARVTAEPEGGEAEFASPEVPVRNVRSWRSNVQLPVVDPARLWMNRSHAGALKPLRPRPRPRLDPPWANMPVWGAAPSGTAASSAAPSGQPPSGAPAGAATSTDEPTRRGRFRPGRFGRTMRR